MNAAAVREIATFIETTLAAYGWPYRADLSAILDCCHALLESASSPSDVETLERMWKVGEDA